MLNIEIDESIGSLVRRMERDYISGQTTSSKYVTTSFSDDVNRIYAYLDSKHISGDTDSLGRDKPFFNISIASRNIWFRATSIKPKGIRLKATKSGDVFTSYLATAKLQEWMRKEKFGKFLNDWGINSAGFNESVLKFVEKDGRLIPSVIPWSRIICDPIDFASNPKIEILELTESQLRKNTAYDQDKVEELCDSLQSRETLDKKKKDTNSNYIKLYEVHGEFSKAAYNQAKGLEVKEGDEDIYFQQMHVISFVPAKKKGEYDDFTLFCGKEDDPYMLASLLPEIDGSIGLKGSVKTQFDSQWMVNHTVKAIKDQLDMSSKLIFQTSDTGFVGRNALTSIETGDILVWSAKDGGSRIEQINNGSHDTGSLQNFNSMWKSVGNEITGISESMLGINPPSGTAWRQTEAILGENHSLFEEMTWNRKLDIEEAMRRFIIPFIKKQLDTKDEVVATLDDYGIDKVEAKYVKSETIKRSNAEIADRLLSGEMVSPEEQMASLQNNQEQVKAQFEGMGDNRFLTPSDTNDKTWKDVFKDYEFEAEVDIQTNDVDKDAATTLNSLLSFFARKQGQPLTPEEKLTVEKILMLTKTVSPMELSSVSSDKQKLPQQIAQPQAVT